MPAVPAIEAQNLHYTARHHFYRRCEPILCGIDFTVEAGEIFGFLGPNGAGKTTTIKILLNLLTPTLGRVLLGGRPSAEPAARQKLGFLPERALYPLQLRAQEFVLGHALLSGLNLARARQRCELVLEQVGLTAVANHALKTFSKGMLQRVGLAQALVGDPDVLILDEPMSGLDPMGRRDVRNIMQSLRAAGKTIFFSTHILPDVELICDRVAIMVAGRLRHIGPMAQLTALGHRGFEVHAEKLMPQGVAAATALCRRARPHASGYAFDITAGVDALAEANRLIDCIRREGGMISGLHPDAGSGLEALFERKEQKPPC